MWKTVFAFSLFAFAGCLTATGATPSKTKPALGEWGVDLTGMDSSVKPGNDFFLYVNGKWLANAQIPPDRASTGSFQTLQILSEKRIKDIITELKTKPYSRLSTEEKKIRDLYDAFLDTNAIEKNGLAPAQKDLNWIASLTTHADIASAMGDPARGTPSLFGTHIEADAKNSNAYTMYVTQSGLGLPDRDFYLRSDPNLAKTRDAYKKYLSTMLTLSGAKDADRHAAKIFDLETRIAKASWPAAERRDTDKTYNPMTFAQLQTLSPGFPWAHFFKAQGLSAKSPSGDRIIIASENTAFPDLGNLFASTPVEVWRDWLTIHYLHHMSHYLPKPFDEANFDFYGKVLGGQQQQLDRVTRSVHQIDGRLGHPLAKLYVARYFPPESKAKADALIANLLKAYDASIRQIPWMTEVTRQKALDKLHTFKAHVAYPEKWRDYSGLRIDKNDLLGNVHRSDLFEWHYQLDRIDQATDRNEWEMTPSTVNAYYTQAFNSIFFPAAILQPPFFDPNADDAVNYGGIGAVIGHEISHGFDDQGSKYDGNGLLRSWWTNEDRQAFDQRTGQLVEQFNTYEPLPTLRINGKLTLGENIGDLSGIAISFKAYHLSQKGKQPKILDGFTGDQRFFLAYAQVWRGKYRDSEMRKLVLSNPHSPPHFRVVGPTRNIDAWYAAFNIKPNDKAYLSPEKRVKLW